MTKMRLTTKDWSLIHEALDYTMDGWLISGNGHPEHQRLDELSAIAATRSAPKKRGPSRAAKRMKMVADINEAMRERLAKRGNK